MTGSSIPVEALISKLYAGAWAGAPADRFFGRMQLVGTPSEAAALLADDETFVKDYDLLTELGHSRFDAVGQDWADRRDLTQPVIRAAAMKRHHRNIGEAYAVRLDSILSTCRSCGTSLSGSALERPILSAASDIMISAFGGRTPGEQLAEWLLSLRPTARMTQRVAMYGARPDEINALRRRIAAARAEIETLLNIDAALMARVRDMDARMAAVPVDPSRKPFDALSEFIVTLLAGTETTAAAMAWSVVGLARDPLAQERIAEEVQEAGAASPALEVLIQETMRYVPPVPLLTRRVTRDGADLAGRPVARNTLLALDIVRLHHDRKLWDRPRLFLADRAAFTERSYHRRAYLPFSAGPRVCGGTGLARAELLGALSALLTRFRIQAPKGEIAISMDYALTLRPRSLSGLQLEPRNG